jgi:EmrB/QacA subfamily drug resistance transporter
MADSTRTTDSTEAAPSQPAYLNHQQILVVMSGLMLGLFLAALDQTIVSTALPTIVGSLGGIEHLSWVVTAYLLTSTASTPLYGKISDLYGRKPVFQFAIVVFLLGSVLAGMAQSMEQLIATRAIQGLGAGGLMALTFAIIGDVIPPRERGRYQGYFGAVWGLSSVAGPLLGGWLTDGPGWRWIFYINVPLGLVALVVTSSVLNIPHTRRDHSIDYLGAALLVAGVSSGLLALVWGGNEYAWSSAQILGLGGGALVLLGAFVWWESRAAEPILPLTLFRNSVFTVTSAVGFVVGLAMFGAIVFLPVYLQVVDGASPTLSGLLMLPMMVGILITSIGSGRLITATGRYKIYPIIGTALITLGMFLLSRLEVDTPRWLSGTYMLVVGLGLGCVMQVLVVAVQNAVDHRDMGVATSASTFFRSIGGTIGTAVFGSVLANRLSAELADRVSAESLGGVDAGSLTGSPDVIRALPPEVRANVVEAFVRALEVVYLTAIPITVAAFVLTWFVKELPLRTGKPVPKLEESAAAPADRDAAATSSPER